MRKLLTSASALLASNVPDAGDGIAILALTEGRTTATVIEVDEGIDTLVFTADQARDRASGETLGARRNITGAVLAFVDVGTLAVTMTVLAITTTMTVLAVIIITMAVLAIIIITMTALSIITAMPIIFSGDIRRGRGLGVRRRGRRRLAAERTGAPIPALRALRRGEGVRGLVGSTAALSRVPRPVVGTVGVGGRAGGVARSSAGETDVLGVPPKNHRSAQPP